MGRYRPIEIETTTPQGMFLLQVLGAVAQIERALIAERTRGGLRAARSRVVSAAGLRAGNPDAIRKVRASRDAAHLDGVLAEARSLDRAPRQPGDDRLIRPAAGIAAAAANHNLQQIAVQLEAMRERPPRRWNAVAPLICQASAHPS